MSCEQCDMAKQVGFGGCAAMASDVFNRLTKALQPTSNKLNKVIKQKVKKKVPNEELAGFVKAARQVAHDGILAFAASMYIGEGKPIEDFMHDAAKMYTHVATQPARDLMQAFQEHLEAPALDQAAKAHSPGN